ncbi:MAG: hypothetical protein J7K72_03020 [Candidatus Aenigmarchaeota archaeon]|nr:hypothetical protein [Candidatus Aenigmarchaeota archaeon]
MILTWAPWLDNQKIHDNVFQEKAHKDGTYGWVIQPNGSKSYELICDYKINYAPLGRWVASCEGGYYVTFWGEIVE